jgi:folate-dependent phosphoribosylglycinamide formyltransferase PurN
MPALRIALLTSRTFPGIGRLLHHPLRGSAWDLSIVVGSGTSLVEMHEIESAGVPVELRPMKLVPAFRNLHARADYDEELGALLERIGVDYVLLTGYPYIVTAPLLARFPKRVLAIHDADLSLERKYTGPRAVREAIFSGERETRCSVYIVTNEVGRGPLFLLGAPYPIAPMALDARERGDIGFLESYAALHRAWMITTAWPDMLARTLELLAGGTIQIIGDVAWIDGAPGPCRFGEAPHACHEPETMLARGIPRSCPFIE